MATEITLKDLTEGKMNGEGIFDELLTTMRVHLDDQFNTNRIKGADYSSVYLGAFETTLTQAIGFLLQKDQAAKQSDLIDAQIKIAEQNILKTQAEIENIKQNTLMMKEQTANIVEERALIKENVLTAKEQRSNLIAQRELIHQNVAMSKEQQQNVRVERDNLVQQVLLTKGQVTKIGEDTKYVIAQTGLVTEQKLNMQSERELIGQQIIKMKSDIKLTDQQIIMSQEQIKNLVSERQRITAQINNLNVTNQKLLSEIDMINQQVTFSKEEQLSLAIQRDKLSTDVLAIEQQIRFNKQQELNLASERKQIDSNIIKTNKDIELMTQQIANAKVQINVLNQQVQKSAAEVAVLKEKRRTEQAQTADTISGVPVTGVMGKQRELYQAQKDGFARKAEQDLAKIMSDSWATRRATDEGTLPSKGLTDVAIDRVLDKAMKSIGTAGTDGIS